MTDPHKLNDDERREFELRGFSIVDRYTARAEGAMSVEVSRHGPYHFFLSIKLPSGSSITGFTPKTRILGGGGDAV